MSRAKWFDGGKRLIVVGIAAIVSWCVVTQAQTQLHAQSNETAAPATDPSAAVFLSGFAERDISPELGEQAPGGYGKAYHRVFHDPCKARAAVFDDGTHVVAIVGLDALLIRKPTVQEIRRRITERTGIPEAHIMIAASHTHAGGPTGMLLEGEYDDESEFVRKLAYDMTVFGPAAYLERVTVGITEAVVEAYEKRSASTAAAGYGMAEGVAFNRRFRMRSGFTMTHPGVGNPDIIEPAGPTDPQVGVLGAWQDGKLVGCIVNFACHATTGPGGISADYVYYLENAIRGVYGDEVVVVFVAGTAGDVTQVNNRTPYAITQFGERAARFVGGTVGAAAARTLMEIETSASSDMSLAAVSRTLSIDRRVPRAERIEAAYRLAEKDPATVDATEWTFAKELVLLDTLIRRDPTSEFEVQALQVGPCVYLACPAEYFVEYGLEMKAESPFPFTFPVSLANDCIGYVPTEEAFSERGGGYETRLTSYSNLIPSAGRTICDQLIELSKSLTPGPVPQNTAAPEFRGQPWTYGSLPPEID